MPRLMIIWSLKSQCKNVLLAHLQKCMNAKSVENHHKKVQIGAKAGNLFANILKFMF